MLNYILKRILLMIPTMFAILLIVFIMVNIAPGTPGQAQNVSGSESAEQSANARESYRLFKLQYHLDKPILFNFRWTLNRPKVVNELKVSAAAATIATPAETLALHVGQRAAQWFQEQQRRPRLALEKQLEDESLTETARVQIHQDIQNLPPEHVDPIRPERPAQARVIRAENRLEDWGHDIVPYLVEIATTYVTLRNEEGDQQDTFFDKSSDEWARLQHGGSILLDTGAWRLDAAQTLKVRNLAVQRLAVNARRRTVVGEGERASPQRIEENREIIRENIEISHWVYRLSDSPELQNDVAEKWARWFETHRDDRYHRTFASRAKQTFFDTRFSHYIANLMPIEFQPKLRLRAPNLGTSMRYRRPVLDVIGEHWQYSVGLSLISLLLAYAIAIPIGVMAAVRHNGPIADRGVGILLFILYSLPVFFGATLLQTWLTPARGLDWFPVSGFDDGRSLERTALEHLWVVTKHLVLPVICLTYPSLAALSRYARSGLLEVIRADYIRTARAKGLPEWIVLLRHAVRNGMIPIITLLGSTLPVVIGGSIVIEYIFAIEGMGALMLQSIGQRDYNVILGVLLLSSMLTLIGILLSDIAYALIDPRISYD